MGSTEQTVCYAKWILLKPCNDGIPCCLSTNHLPRGVVGLHAKRVFSATTFSPRSVESSNARAPADWVLAIALAVTTRSLETLLVCSQWNHCRPCCRSAWCPCHQPGCLSFPQNTYCRYPPWFPYIRVQMSHSWCQIASSLLPSPFRCCHSCGNRCRWSCPFVSFHEPKASQRKE